MKSAARIQSLDFNRGLALIGIFLVNLYLIHEWSGIPFFLQLKQDPLFGWFFIIFKAKFFVIFACLFGIGIAIMIENQKKNSQPVFGLLHRRLLILAGIGLIHYQFIWIGDILLVYAFIGWLLLLVRNWSKWFFLSIVISFYLLDIITLVVTQLQIVEIPFLTSFSQFYQANVTLFHASTYLSLGYIWFRDFSLKERLQQIPYLWRGCLIFGGITAIGFISWLSGVNLELILTCFHLPQAFFYFFLFSLICICYKNHWLIQVISNYGRMALTHYLMQSLIGNFIILRFLTITSIHEVILWTLLVTGLQILLSQLWLRYFYYGPIEWLWRWGSYRVKPKILKK